MQSTARDDEYKEKDKDKHKHKHKEPHSKNQVNLPTHSQLPKTWLHPLKIYFNFCQMPKPTFETSLPSSNIGISFIVN